jgi:K+-sensing histidine kinase KdpD
MPGAVDAPVRQRAVLRRRTAWAWPAVGAGLVVIGAGVVVAALLGARVGTASGLPGPFEEIVMVAAALVAGLMLGRERALRRTEHVLHAERGYLVELEHQLHAARAVDAAVRAINSSGELDQVRAGVLAEAVRLLEADDGSLLVVEDDRLVVAATAGRPGEVFGTDQGLDPDQTTAGWVAARRRPLLLGEPTHGKEFPGMRPEPLSSVVSVPLTVGDTLVGVLSVGIADPARAFDSGDEHLLVLLAGHAAIAVTGARRLADQRASLVALSEADRRRSDMVAMITHDLKTPLTSLIGYVHLLRKRGEKVTAAERGGFYSHMDRQARRMLEMVEDLLVSSRVEQGASSLKREPLDLGGIVEEIRGLFAGRAPERRIEVRSTPLMEPVYGDRSAVAHVLQNLVDNALKYSPAGSPVRILVEDQACQVVLVVADEGDGIPPGETTGIFERFNRGAGHGPRGSVGLGLHVVKTLVTAHGGRVWCESEPGAGARFIFTLPRRSGAEVAAGRVDAAMR